MQTASAIPRPGIVVTRRGLAIVLAVLLAMGAAYVYLEMHFAYRAPGFPLAATPSLTLEFKEALGWQQFHSQFGQDKWIMACVFPGVRDGYYVDIGCGDGVIDSNSKALEDLGWKGIGVDPFPVNWEGRKGSLFREVVFSKKGETVQFRKAGFIGGIDHLIDAHRQRSAQSPVVEFTTTTIADILERAAAPLFIHYVSLDVEGAELDVLRAFPFAKHRVGAWTIEHNGEEPKRSQVRELLARHGYQLERQQLVDDWYVAEER